MNALDNYPRPWRVTTTSRWRARGYNYHIRAANDMYVAERLTGGEAVATIIVEGVNERDERDRLRAELAELQSLLQERCVLLGRALAAVWSLLGEEDQQALMAVLDLPSGTGKTMPAKILVEMLERKGGAA